MSYILRSVFSVAVGLLVAAGVSAQTTIDFWQFWTDPEVKPVITELVREFEAANPEIEVNVTDLTWANGHEKIVVAFASETGPDVVELGSDWIAQFAESGHIEGIGDRIAADSNQYQGWSMANYKDKIYGMPWILGTRVLYINLDLSDRAFGTTSAAPATWPQLKSACQQIDDLDDDIYGWGSNTAEKHRLYKKFLPFFWANEGQLFTDDGRYCILASVKAVEALKYYKELHDLYGYVANQRGIEDAFLDGKIGFIISGDWLLRRIAKENRDLNFATSFIPGPEMRSRSFMGGEFLALNSASDKKDAAYTFMRFMASPESQVRICKAGHMANPSSTEAQKDAFFTEDENLQTFIKQLRFAEHPPVHPDWVDMEAIIEAAIEEALFGEDDLVAQPLYDAQKKIQSIIDK